LSKLSFLSERYGEYLKSHAFQGHPYSLYEPMNYIMSLGGKRIRPLLVLLGADACNSDIDIALPVAHATEVFHNFTLVHDDIMDNAPTRRGMPTVHEKWNTAEAILSGDNMLIAVYDILLKNQYAGQMKLLSLFNKTAREVCEGQQLDMDFASLSHVTESQYMEMIRLKTAVLLGFSLQAGAILADADARIQELMYDFAINLGLSFQLNDDWLDAFGDPAQTGKKPGGDIAEGKKTWLYIKASAYFDIDALWNEKTGTERIEATTSLFLENRLDGILKEKADEYAAKSLADLQELDNSGIDTTGLAELTRFLQMRSH